MKGHNTSSSFLSAAAASTLIWCDLGPTLPGLVAAAKTDGRVGRQVDVSHMPHPHDYAVPCWTPETQFAKIQAGRQRASCVLANCGGCCNASLRSMLGRRGTRTDLGLSQHGLSNLALAYSKQPHFHEAYWTQLLLVHRLCCRWEARPMHVHMEKLIWVSQLRYVTQ